MGWKSLIDTGCGRTLVEKAKAPFTPEVLHMQRIHRDVQEYHTKLITTGIGPQMFTCQVGIVSHLDCGVLIGRDCPIMAQLLQWGPPQARSPVSGFQRDPVEGVGWNYWCKYLTCPFNSGRPLNKVHPRGGAGPTPPATEQAPCFTLDKGVLYR